MAQIWQDTFETDLSWSLNAAMVWERGAPTQVSPYAGSNVLATDLSANYPDNVGSPSYATSPVIDCSAYSSCTLTFQRNAAFENNSDFDTFTVEVFDGAIWQTVWTSDDTVDDIDDSDWTEQTPDISTYADGNADFQIRFSGESDTNTNFRGWFIDNVTVDGTPDTTYELTGITKDKDGNVLGECDVMLVKDLGSNVFSFIDYALSNVSTGVYVFGGLLDNDANYQVIAWKDNTPHVFDVTEWDLAPTVE